MPPVAVVDFVGEEPEVWEPKIVEALTTLVTVGVVTLLAEAAFTPLLSRTIVGFWGWNLQFRTFTYECVGCKQTRWRGDGFAISIYLGHSPKSGLYLYGS